MVTNRILKWNLYECMANCLFNVQGSCDIMKSSRIYEVDRISALLEPILHHILSFLSFEEVAWTSLFLKSWKQVWPTFPDVVVGDISIKKRRWEMILKSLEQTLLNRQGQMISVKKFNLILELSITSLRDQCLGLFVSNKWSQRVATCFWHSGL